MKGFASGRQKGEGGMVERFRAPPAEDVVAADAGELYRKYAETVGRWVARLGGPLIDREDAVHEVFVIAHRLRPSAQGAARITTWLFRVTAKVVSHRRRKDRWRRWLRGSADEAVGRLAADGPSPVEALESREQQTLVYRVLDRLPDRHRTVLILFEMDGLSGDEIASLFDAKVSTIWVWLHRARASFRAELSRLEAEGVVP
jgi:RNA polymerase sigma-70 factor (ECF subfamily)